MSRTIIDTSIVALLPELPAWALRALLTAERVRRDADLAQRIRGELQRRERSQGTVSA